MSEDKKDKPGDRYISTSGGSYIEGESKVEGGDFVGRDIGRDRRRPDYEFPGS